MSALAALGNYAGSSDSENEDEEVRLSKHAIHTIDPKDIGSHLNPQNLSKSSSTKAAVLQVTSGQLVSAPDVVASDAAFKYGHNSLGTVDANLMTVDPNAEAIEFNATYEQLFKQAEGPARPRGEKMVRNVANGYLEGSSLNPTIFEEQRRQFAQWTKLEKKTAAQIDTNNTVSLRPHVLVNRDINCKQAKVKRKRMTNKDAGDLDGYTAHGWADFEDQVHEEGPSEADREILDEYLVKMRKKGMKCRRMNFLGRNAPDESDERFELHVKEDERLDYQGREWFDIEQVKQREQISTKKPLKCYMPKKMIHKYIAPVAEGMKKGLTQLRLSEAAPHLFVTAGFDGVARIFRLYGKRQLRGIFFLDF